MTVAVTILEKPIMKLTISCAGVLNLGYNFRHDTAFLHVTTGVHVLLEMGTNTETQKGRMQNGEHTCC